MLVLSRKVHEKLILTIDDTEIVVCVVKIEGNRVRIGIQAPKDVKVCRQELLNNDDGPRNTEACAPTKGI